MATAKYYRPRVDRDLVSVLYHAAKSRRIPMTRLASTLIRQGLRGLSGGESGDGVIVCEDPPALDPGGRKL